MVTHAESSGTGLSERLDELSVRARREFFDVADYFWKAPRLVDHETLHELAKLDEPYFAANPDVREWRWKREAHKLNHTFPYLIATGNLFSALSLFETYLLLLVGELQPYTPVKLQQVKGNGVSRLFSYFRASGLTPERLPLHEQVQAAIKIRNCLMHASGMLDWSRENDDLRRIQSTGLHLSREHRKRSTEIGMSFDTVRVGKSELGDRLIVHSEYCHLLCSYLHKYYSELCSSADIALTPPASK